MAALQDRRMTYRMIAEMSEQEWRDLACLLSTRRMSTPVFLFFHHCMLIVTLVLSLSFSYPLFFLLMFSFSFSYRFIALSLDMCWPCWCCAMLRVVFRARCLRFLLSRRGFPTESQLISLISPLHAACTTSSARFSTRRASARLNVFITDRSVCSGREDGKSGGRKWMAVPA